MRDAFVTWFLLAMLRRLPMLLVAAAGIIFALVRRKVHPKASLLTVIALVIYYIEVIVYNIFLYFLPNMVEPMHLYTSGMRWVYSIVYFGEDICAAVIIILLVAAAFIGRRPSESIPQTA